MLIIDDLLLLPFKLYWNIFNGIKKEVDKELYPDESQVKEKLISLQMSLDSGKITEEAYERQEEKLMKRLRFLREYRKKEVGK